MRIIKVVDNFVYIWDLKLLLNTMDLRVKLKNDINSEIDVEPIVKDMENHNISLSTKVHLVNILVFSVFLFYMPSNAGC